MVAPLARLFEFLKQIGCVAIGAILGLYLLEILLRYVFNSPTSWSVDLITYFLPSAVFLPLPEVTWRRAHISIPILVELLPESFTPPLRVLTAVFVFAISCLVIYIAGIDFIRLLATGEETSGVTPIPKWWVAAPIVLGLSLSVVAVVMPPPPKSQPKESEM